MTMSYGMLKICPLKEDPNNILAIGQCRDWTLINIIYSYRKRFVTNICNTVAILDRYYMDHFIVNIDKVFSFKADMQEMVA